MPERSGLQAAVDKLMAAKDTQVQINERPGVLIVRGVSEETRSQVATALTHATLLGFVKISPQRQGTWFVEVLDDRTNLSWTYFEANLVMPLRAIPGLNLAYSPRRRGVVPSSHSESEDQAAEE